MADCTFLNKKKKKKRSHQNQKIKASVSTEQATQYHKGNLKNQQNYSNSKKFPPDLYACGRRKGIGDCVCIAGPYYSSTVLDTENWQDVVAFYPVDSLTCLLHL